MSRLESFLAQERPDPTPLRLGRSQPPRTRSRSDVLAEEIERERQRRANAPGFFRAVADSVNSENSLAFLYRGLDRYMSFSFDPAFDPLDHPDLLEGLDSGQMAELGNATSLRHAESIKRGLVSTRESRERLGQLGLKGAGLRILAQILDPAAIAVSAASVGLASPFVFATKAGRLTRLARGGAIAGLTEGSIEAAFFAQPESDRQPSDILYTALGAFVLGGGVSALIDPNKAARLARSAQKELDVRAVEESGLTLTADGKVILNRELLDAERRSIAERLAATLDQPAEDIAAVDDFDLANILEQQFKKDLDAADFDDILGVQQPEQIRALGAASEETIEGAEPPSGPPLRERTERGDFVADNVENETDLTSRVRWPKVRYSIVGRVGASANEMVRKVVNVLANDLVVRKNAILRDNAESYLKRRKQLYFSQYARTFEPAYRKWAQEQGVNHLFLKNRQRFRNEVGLAIRETADHADENVMAVVRQQRKLQAKLLDEAKRHGMRGMAEVAENPQYLMRVPMASRLNAAYSKFGVDAVHEQLAQAILKSSDDIDIDKARKIADFYADAVMRKDQHAELNLNRLWFDGDADALQEALERTGAPDDDIAKIIKEMAEETADPDAGKPPRAKRRLRVDETHKASLRDTRTGATEEFRITDLFDNDAESLYFTYTRQILGHSAVSELYRVMKDSPDEIINSFDDIFKKLDKEQRILSRGMQPAAARKSNRKFNQDIKRLRVQHDAILGKRINPDSGVNTFLRTLKTVNYITTSGQFGVAQLAELGNTIAETGLRAMWQQMPALGHLVREARAGRISNGLVELAEAAQTSARLRNGFLDRLDEFDTVVQFQSGLERQLDKVSRVANLVNLFHPIDTLSRTWSVAAGLQKWANFASSNRIPSAKRLRALNMTEADAQRITDQIRKHATTYEGVTGRRLKDINMHLWDDQDAASLLTTSMDRWARRMIQDQDVSNAALWMHRDHWKIVTQFRSFVSTAWEKQFLHKLSVNDFQAWAGFSSSMMVAGIAYIIQQNALLIGADKERSAVARKRMLSTRAIAQAAFQRSGTSSILPIFADPALYALGVDNDMFFANFRQSQLGNDPVSVIIGNPTFSSLGKAIGTSRAGIRSLGEEQFTKTDARRFSKLMPFRNVFGIKNVYDAIADQFPEDR